MLERFTDRARYTLVLAQEEARLLNHGFVGTEHILLGLIHEGEGVAARSLGSLGISLEALRGKVTEIVGTGVGPARDQPFTPRAKKVLELALRESLLLASASVDTEHLLLGLLREGEGVAARSLVSLGVDLNQLRQRLIQNMQSETDRGSIGILPQKRIAASIGPRHWKPPLWARPSDGVLPCIYPVNTVVHRSEEVVIAVDHLRVYPNGFEIHVTGLLDPHQQYDLVRRGRTDRWPRLAVRFANGQASRRGVSEAGVLKDDRGLPTEPYVTTHGGGGGPTSWRFGFWVFPLPPDGPMEVSVSAPVVGVEEASASLDGSAIRAAAQRAQVIWA